MQCSLLLTVVSVVADVVIADVIADVTADVLLTINVYCMPTVPCPQSITPAQHCLQ